MREAKDSVRSWPPEQYSRPPFDSLTEDNVVPLRSFNAIRFIFEEVETIQDGLGPV
jgi:hypothetical protein